MDSISSVVSSIANFLWGPPLLILLLGTGLYLTILLKGLQFRALWHSLYLALIKRKEQGDAQGDITHFQALMTALAATVGTGNIAGVATAIAVGGPGALFWMWITGLVGMATKYAEAVLAVKYRVAKEDGEMAGGPMYYLSRGANMPRLGKAFAFFAAFAAFGIGNMVQANSVADAVRSSFGVPVWISGMILAVLTGLVIIGGIKSIARVTDKLVPSMIVFYIVAAIVALIINAKALPAAFELILVHAFSPTAAAGGFAGSTVMLAIRYGVARGMFSNESGLGSSPIAAAAAKTNHPVTQALVSMTQTFIDTIVVCTMTGLVIITSGAYTFTDAAGAQLTGAPLTSAAFGTILSPHIGNFVVAIGLIVFAYSTILGWSYYGEKSIEYLLGSKSIKPYRLLFSIVVFFGAIAKLELVWTLSDAMNALMALPNLIGLIVLSMVVVKETDDYFKRYRSR